MQDNYNWHTLDSSDDVADAVCQRILAAAAQAIAERGIFKLVLAGGSTPEKIYRLLAKTQADWDKWFVYHGDERCLPEDDKDRNSFMATQAFLAHVAIPHSHIFNIPAELGPVHAAKIYQAAIVNSLPFDMVLLGMGEDGHTASLFPGHKNNPDEWVHAVFNSPKPPPERVSMSAKTLSTTQHLIFIITGAGKRDALQQWRTGQALPVASIQPVNRIDVYLDKDAEPV